MKFTVEFNTIKELKTKLSYLIEELEPSVQTSFDELVNEPIVAKIEEVKVEDVEEIKQPKRKRKTKQVEDVEEIKPLTLEQPILEEVKPLTLEQPILEEVKPLTLEQPKNFFSETEFIANFVAIINLLLNNKDIDHLFIQQKCAKYDVMFLYQLVDDKIKLIDLYTEMVTEGLITKKGDY